MSTTIALPKAYPAIAISKSFARIPLKTPIVRKTAISISNSNAFRCLRKMSYRNPILDVSILQHSHGNIQRIYSPVMLHSLPNSH